MSILSALKKFFTLEEAATYLSNELGESVSLATIYQLIDDHQLTLSVRLINQAYALKGQIFECEDGDLVEFKTELTTGEVLDTPYFDYVPDDNSLPISVDKLFIYDDKAHVIDGTWNLAMVGEEALKVEQLYLNEVDGPQPLLTSSWGFYLTQGKVVCRLITKSQEKIDEIQDDITSGLASLAGQRGLTVDEYMSFIEERWEELSEDEIQAIDHLSALAELPSDSLKFYEDSRSLEENDVQLVIKTSELTRVIGLLDASSGAVSQEVNQSVQKAYTRYSDKQIANKAKTQVQYSGWQKKATELKKEHPNKPKTWIAAQIAKLPISEGKRADTIRKKIII